MDELAVKTVKNGFQSFQTSIKFRTTDKPNDIIQQAISRDPKIKYYLHSFLVVGIFGGYEIRAQYIHKDTDRADIQIVISQDECEKLICQYVGKYKKKLIAVAKGNIDLSKAMKTFHEKHASFYPNLTNTSGINYHSSPEYTVFEFKFEYRIGQVKLAQMEQEVSSEIDRVSMLLFKPNMPNEAKIYLAHNYLATTVDYVDDDDNRLDLSYTQSAYGALIKKQCVCQGFAEAFKRLMDVAKIDCNVIYGQNIGSTVLHAWNLVALGNGSSFYHIDVTWDATGTRPGYLYFCKNDIFFNGKRTWNREYNPKCNGTFPVLSMARKYVMLNKQKLVSGGIDSKVLDC